MEINQRTAAFAISIVFITVIITISWKVLDKSSVKLDAQSVLSSDNDQVSDRYSDIEYVIDRIETIEHKLKHFEVSVSSLQKAIGDLRESIELSDPTQSLISLTEEKSFADSPRLFSPEEKRKELALLDERFHHEQIDVNWAISMEAKLNDIFQKREFHSKGDSLIGVTCKAISCRMEVSHRNELNQMDFTTMASNQPMSSYVQELDTGNEKELKTVVYFIKRGEEDYFMSSFDY